MPLDAELRTIVDLVNSADAMSSEALGAVLLRKNYDQMAAHFGSGPRTAREQDMDLPADGGPIPVRLYSPLGLPDGPAPALVWFHGGGHVIGSLDGYDQVCRRLADSAGVVVISVDYRLAPEDPFPAAVDDAMGALAAVVEMATVLGVDPGRLAVGGDSAGGNLAAVVARRWRDRVGRDGALPPLRFQLLVYPVCDMTRNVGRFPSLSENGEGYLLTTATMNYFTNSYLPDPGARTHPDASPILADDLAGLAPALVITAEFDPLRDEGEEYGSRMARAGVPVTVSRYDGAIHLFFHMCEITGIGRRATDEAAAALKEHLGAD